MLLLTILNNSHGEYVLEKVHDILDYFKGKGLVLRADIKSSGIDGFIDIYFEGNEYTDSNRKLFNYHIANVLYGVMVEDFTDKRVNKYLGDTYSFLNFKDINIVKESIEKVLREEMPIDDTILFCMNKKNNVLKKITICLEESLEINIKGFLNFRAKGIMIDIYEIVEKVVERYMVEKEYNEFISLLKYFVEVQESKLDRIDIFIGRGEGEYILKDEFGNDMMSSLIEELCENKNIVDISKDDLVISGLITTCPQKIVIHSASRCRNKELLKTITSVFESRVEYCEGCNECSILSGFVKIPIDNHINV